jgi:hypothetical protein
MNWRAVARVILKDMWVLKVVLALACVMAVLMSEVGGPEETVEQAIQLAESDPFLLLSYAFRVVIWTAIAYVPLSVFCELSHRMNAINFIRWWERKDRR